MAMKRHAVLSPSGAVRWLACTPSARLEGEFPDTAGEAAAEGTAAHALCEHKLKKAVKRRSRRPHSDFDSDEMEDCTDGYVAFVLEQMAAIPQPLVCIEQRLDLTAFVPEAFGTADCLIVGDGTLHIIDFKYGLGVLVEADHNPQMMLYALGALELFDGIYDIDAVSMTIYQPRRSNVSTHTLFKESLYQWAEEVLKPTAEIAYAGGGEYNSGEWCQFCKAKYECRKRAERNLELAKLEFKRPPLLEDDEVESILCKIDALVSWASDLKDYALQAAISGKQWLGWKLVEGKSSRRYVNDDAVAEMVLSEGYDPYERKVMGITAMEKALGKTKFVELIGDLVEKPQGKPTLVPEGDKRPAIHNAKNDFMEGKDNG